MWNRMWAYPFDVVIPKQDQVGDFADLLVREHGSGVLAWMVEGAKKYYEAECKLGQQPEAMQNRRQSWQERDDIVKRWIDDCVEVKPRKTRRAADYWNSFRDWCKDQGEDVALREYRARTFHEEMDNHFPDSRGGALQGSFARKGMDLK